MSPARSQHIAALFRRRARMVERMVRARANVPGQVIEDACQTAWERLCEHAEVELQDALAVRWLVITATREAWKRGRTERGREPDGRDGPSEPEAALEERVIGASDPCEVVLRRETHRERVRELAHLTPREQRFLALHAVGLSYREVARVEQASLRTVERQILRARRKLHPIQQS